MQNSPSGSLIPLCTVAVLLAGCTWGSGTDDKDTVWMPSMLECVRGEPSDDLDLANVCVEGACGGMDFYEVKEVLGEVVDCEPEAGVDNRVLCSWQTKGVVWRFVDGDQDGVPDSKEEGDVFDSNVWLGNPYSGTTEAGLGRRVPVSCFVEELGCPVGVTCEDAWEQPSLRWELQTGAIETSMEIELSQQEVSGIILSWSWYE